MRQYINSQLPCRDTGEGWKKVLGFLDFFFSFFRNVVAMYNIEATNGGKCMDGNK